MYIYIYVYIDIHATSFGYMDPLSCMNMFCTSMHFLYTLHLYMNFKSWMWQAIQASLACRSVPARLRGRSLFELELRYCSICSTRKILPSQRMDPSGNHVSWDQQMCKNQQFIQATFKFWFNISEFLCPQNKAHSWSTLQSLRMTKSI